MAIISGGRLNIWNAVKKQFEVVHPETEVARITDFADGTDLCHGCNYRIAKRFLVWEASENGTDCQRGEIFHCTEWVCLLGESFRGLNYTVGTL